MAFSNKRKEDERMSAVISQFMDDEFYNKYTTDFERVDDHDRQVQGIDVIFECDGNRYVCDEKAAIRYVNKNLTTFALELSFIDRGDAVHSGWLVDENKINNSFMFIWPDEADNDVINDVCELRKVHAALIRKEKIIDYLNSKGWSLQLLSEKGQRMRLNENENAGSIAENGLKFVCSRRLAEQPVNVLLSRQTLDKLADKVIDFERP